MVNINCTITKLNTYPAKNKFVFITLKNKAFKQNKILKNSRETRIELCALLIGIEYKTFLFI